MRRVFSLILLGLGVFAIAIAVLLPTFVYPKLAKVPLDQNSTSVLEGSDIQVLAVTGKGAELRKGANLAATAKVQANFEPAEMKAGTDVAVWLLAVQVVDTKDNTIVSASKRQVCFDRRTAEGYVPKDGEEPKCQAKSSFVTKLDESKKVPEGAKPPEKNVERTQPGLQFKFPFGTEQKTYNVYDDNTGTAVPAEFKGTDTINGVEVYKFVQNIGDTQIATKTVPGSLIGSPEDSVKDVPLFYKGTITMWVEPVTGVQVKQSQQQHQELRPAIGSGSTTVVFDGTLTFNQKTINGLVDQVKANKGKLDFITFVGPLAFGIGGGVMILAGLFLLLRGRKAEPEPDDRATPQHARTKQPLF
ncbi:DUF3068 domain-containing protein [Amycolatopsis sp. NPDC059657]|uniref:DUF3068 domain-containing protein n=1 Tax=Amycolatopsis sp. NPDC059657 TaxID=3346899 RepID=UPI00366FDDEB